MNEELNDSSRPLEVDGQESESLSLEERIHILEALIFAQGEPLSVDSVVATQGWAEEAVLEAFRAVQEKFSNLGLGFVLACVGGQYQFRTRPELACYLQALKAGGPRRLTGQALETLAIVAYRQPVVKSDIEKLRGVDATPTLKTLLDRNLIKVIGQQATVGQPALYGTTDDFLKIFGLKSLADLPQLRELSAIEIDPGETAPLAAEFQNHSLIGEPISIDDQAESA